MKLTISIVIRILIALAKGLTLLGQAVEGSLETNHEKRIKPSSEENIGR